MVGGRKALRLCFVGWIIWVLLKDHVSLQHSELSIPPELHVLNNCSPGQVSLSTLAATAAATEGLLCP